MLLKIARSLAALYQEDLKDYEGLLGKMQEFQKFLNKRPGNRTEKVKADNCEKDKSPSTLPSLGGKEHLEQELLRFTVFREEIFKRLQERACRTAELQRKICAETGSPAFQAADLKPYLENTVYEEISSLTVNLRARMAEILELDNYILPRLNMELEAVKLKLHRLQDAKKTKNAYESQGRREARFIDKTK